MAIEPEIFRFGMRRLASGVSIITTVGTDGPRGLTATAICSVAIDPPTLLCCINRSASAHDTILAARVLAVNFLAESDQALATRFSGVETRDSRFVHGCWTVLETGSPILETALASFDCTVTGVIDGASHSVFLAEVIATRFGEVAAAPLLYFDGAYGGLVTAPEP